MISDVLSDMLARIRNGLKAGKKTVVAPFSNHKKDVLEVLKNEGFIESYEKVSIRKGVDDLEIQLKYFQGESVIKEMKKISKLGCRIYAKADKLPRIYNGLGVAIISTSKGIMTDANARKNGLGGEVLCSIF